MMELPDIERMIERFAGYATGKTISAVIIDDYESVDIDMDLGEQVLRGHAIDVIERRGRYVVIRFRSEHSLVFHMGSDGEVYLESQTAPPRDNSKLRLQFAAGRELRFASTGADGEVHLVEGDNFKGLGNLENLGIDPLSEDFVPELFARLALSHPRASLKGLLMNQEVVAGIGNEYADEICFQAGYRPDTRVGDMTPYQLERVHLNLRRVLRRATLHWQAAHADPGWLINYRNRGTSCPRCTHVLHTMRVAGKTTFMCSRCQRAA